MQFVFLWLAWFLVKKLLWQSSHKSAFLRKQGALSPYQIHFARHSLMRTQVANQRFKPTVHAFGAAGGLS